MKQSVKIFLLFTVAHIFLCQELQFERVEPLLSMDKREIFSPNATIFKYQKKHLFEDGKYVDLFYHVEINKGIVDLSDYQQVIKKIIYKKENSQIEIQFDSADNLDLFIQTLSSKKSREVVVVGSFRDPSRRKVALMHQIRTMKRNQNRCHLQGSEIKLNQLFKNAELTMRTNKYKTQSIQKNEIPPSQTRSKRDDKCSGVIGWLTCAWNKIKTFAEGIFDV